MKVKRLCVTAVFLALVFVVTRFIQVPIPLGYFNIGNAVILVGCVLLPAPYGIISGSLGSALADLTSYPVYTVPTLIIKALFPFVYYVLQNRLPGSKYVRKLLAAAISTLVPLFGYTIVGGILYGSIATGLAQFPGLLLEYVANLILFAVLLGVLEKNPAIRRAVDE